MMAEYWTLVLNENDATDGFPVAPFDCNPGNSDEGMLVYYSEAAAKTAAKHQLNLYGVVCRPCRLGQERIEVDTTKAIRDIAKIASMLRREKTPLARIRKAAELMFASIVGRNANARELKAMTE
jgi:hypothetical protein